MQKTIQSRFDINNPTVQKYLRQIQSRLLVNFFFLTSLPSALWWGIKIKKVTTEIGQVEIPFNWRTQNPFKSIYFAAQAGAAELSTGVLVNLAKAGRGRISMLVVDFRAEYFKKANSKITFSCDDGLKIIDAMNRAIESDEGQVVEVLSTGRNVNGEVVSKFYISWSLKVKN